MTSASSPVSLANRALLQIGARASISSLTEGSTESDAVNILFVPVFQQLARAANWNCLRNQATLTLIAAAQGTPENVDGTILPLPPSPWLYAYQCPSDNLQIRFILPSQTNNTASGTIPLTTINNLAQTWVPGAYQIPFAVAYGTDSSNNPIEIILTNQTQAIVVYTVDQSNPVVFDSLFEQAFVSSLAAFLAPALTLNIPLMKIAIAQADAAIAQARVRDGDEGYTSQNRQADWMVARATGYLSGPGFNGLAPWGSANYTSMSWPVV